MADEDTKWDVFTICELNERSKTVTIDTGEIYAIGFKAINQLKELNFKPNDTVRVGINFFKKEIFWVGKQKEKIEGVGYASLATPKEYPEGQKPSELAKSEFGITPNPKVSVDEHMEYVQKWEDGLKAYRTKRDVLLAISAAIELYKLELSNMKETPNLDEMINQVANIADKLTRKVLECE